MAQGERGKARCQREGHCCVYGQDPLHSRSLLFTLGCWVLPGPVDGGGVQVCVCRGEGRGERVEGRAKGKKPKYTRLSKR